MAEKTIYKQYKLKKEWIKTKFGTQEYKDDNVHIVRFGKAIEIQDKHDSNLYFFGHDVLKKYKKGFWKNKEDYEKDPNKYNTSYDEYTYEIKSDLIIYIKYY